MWFKMTGIFEFAIRLTLIITIYAVIDSFVSNFKLSKYVKSIVALVMVFSLFHFLSNLNLKFETNFNIEEHKINKAEIWDNTLSEISKELETQIMNLCTNSGLKIDHCNVELETDYSAINIKAIKIYGQDKIAAKNLVAGYFKINSAYINISGEKSIDEGYD